MAIYGLLQSSISWKDNHISSKEQLTYHVEKKYKVGKVPVGMHSTSALKSIDINASVRVKYNPNKPKQSYCRITMDFIWDRDGV